VSALGLHDGAASGFLRSKLAGERALLARRLDCVIVRPSLLDGEGGFGARWLRRMAAWPLHLVPASAAGCIAPLDVRDLGDAIAALCERPPGAAPREVELGGAHRRAMREHLCALRALHRPAAAPATAIAVPNWLARLGSHACDLLHFSPFSFGHLELMGRDNVPRVNVLPELLGRAPRAVGCTMLPTPRQVGTAGASAPG
jgi:NADH dehydrogenase